MGLSRLARLVGLGLGPQGVKYFVADLAGPDEISSSMHESVLSILSGQHIAD